MAETMDEKPAAPAKAPLERQWYVVHTYSGFEHKVKQSLEATVRQLLNPDLFGEILVPSEKVVELVKGKKKTSSRKFFPGYILVNMHLNNQTWHIVKNTPKVTGFIGGATDPSTIPPISEREVREITHQMEEGAVKPKPKVLFEQGESVKVIDGQFQDFNGTVEEVKPDKGKLRVLISIFGRATPVELDFVQVEKA